MVTANLRPPIAADVNDLVDIDLKCFLTPWEQVDWVNHGPEYGISVATLDGHPVGFAAARDDIGEEIHSYHLLKIGVRKGHRLQTIGTQLMEAMIEDATVRNFDEMHTVIAESLAYSVHRWLRRFDFKATGVQRDKFFNWGEVEDGIRFARSI